MIQISPIVSNLNNEVKYFLKHLLSVYEFRHSAILAPSVPKVANGLGRERNFMILVDFMFYIVYTFIGIPVFLFQGKKRLIIYDSSQLAKLLGKIQIYRFFFLIWHRQSKEKSCGINSLPVNKNYQHLAKRFSQDKIPCGVMAF